MPLDTLFNLQKSLSEAVTVESFTSAEKPFLIVSYSLGRDSTALLIKLAQFGIRPDKIIFADTGAEKDASYAYLDTMQNYLDAVGFPKIEVVSLFRRRDRDFETHLFRLGIFASLTYGTHKCSATWKIEAIENYLKADPDYRRAKRQNRRIVRAIGFEKGEEYRVRRNQLKTTGKTSCKNGSTFQINAFSSDLSWFPLIELNLDFDGVLDTIWREGLPIPPKSSCYFCAGMRETEIYQLSQTEPHKFFRALVLERLAQRNPIVPHNGRVQGISFGKKWSDYECADPFVEAVEKAIEIFELDRRLADGDARRGASGWRQKREKVELFIECFESADKLNSFMNEETDLDFVAHRINEINMMAGSQLQLPIKS